MNQKKGKKKVLVLNSNMRWFSAWCSGTAYNYPDRVFMCDKTREIALFTHGVYLARFSFKTVEEYNKAIAISKRALRKSMPKAKITIEELPCKT